MLKKLLDDFLCWIGYYPPTLVKARKQAIENHKIYESALKKAKPAVKRKPAAKKVLVKKVVAKKVVAKKTVKGKK